VNLLQQVYNPESGEVAELRRLYSKLRNTYRDQHVRNVLITSATVAEGKSTLAAFLAATMALFRQTRTLLVDCDLRRPRVHEFFGCNRDRGLAEVLAGEASLEACFKSTHIKSLSILTSGSLRASPVELLNSSRVHEVFAEMKFYFDSIVIDSPPVIPVSDTLFLSPEVDGVLIVVKAGATPRQVVKRAVDNLKDAGVSVLGVVLNNMKSVLPYYYDYSYYGYEYYRGADNGASAVETAEDSFAQS